MNPLATVEAEVAEGVTVVVVRGEIDVSNGDDIQAANPGEDTGPCSPPALMGIDWIFGTSDLVFSDYRRVSTRSSDHPMLVTSIDAR